MILAHALTFAIACFALALLLNLWRLVTAPTLTDRVLAVDTMTVNLIALVTLFTARAGSSILFEVPMLLALTGFVSTVAYAKFILRGSIIE